jgi:phenylphosphate carboxylase alpha subunit
MAISKAPAAQRGFGCPGDLREYLEVLERAGELRRVTAQVDWRYEAGAMSRLANERRGPAPVFENVKDYPGQKIAAVLLGPSKPALHARTSLALGLDKLTPPLELIEAIRQRLKSPIAPITVRREQALCKEVVVSAADADLNKFAFPWIKETLDGGRYLGTWDTVVIKDPDSGWVNWGMYRCMVKDAKNFTILLEPGGQHGGAILKKYEAMGKPMPIALVIGSDPICALAGVTPMDYGITEAEIAGALRGEAVPLVKCETSDIEVPATAEIVIEAEVLPGQRVDEGPFGEYTGHSACREKTPVARVTCITHRKNPINTLANMGKPWDDCAPCANPLTAAVAKNRLETHGINVKALYPYVPREMVVAIKPAPGLKQRILSVMDAGERLLSWGIVFVDEDVDVTNAVDVLWAIFSRMNPETYEVIRGRGANSLCAWLTPEERERREAGAWVIDATFPYHWSKQYREDHTRVSDFEHGWSGETKAKILARWKDYGYGDIT